MRVSNVLHIVQLENKAVMSVMMIRENLLTSLPFNGTVRVGCLATEWRYKEKLIRWDSRNVFTLSVVRRELPVYSNKTLG